MKKYLFGSVLALAVLMNLTACNKDDEDNHPAEKASVTMRLTDAPAEYDAVYLDIQSVEMVMNEGGTITLHPVIPGVYDILRFRNGLDTLLLQADIPAGSVSQIRLVLGDNNSVVVNGVSHPLTTPSGQTSGIKLNLNQNFVAGGAYVIWIDFDAARSIHETGNGNYMLKPVIRAYSEETDGRIEGYVIPLAALTTVYAINGTDTFAAIPDPSTAYFRFGGLPAGTYDVWFDATALGYQDEVISNVSVTYGMKTDLGTITLTP